MRQKGSMLVVVLGLLAILAVIGVTFLTLSSLERTTAASFAFQTQMMLAADGAIEYAVHEMVLDVWEWEIYEVFKFRFTGKLLTGRQAGLDPVDGKTYGACETYDYFSAATDAWLSKPIISNATPNPISFSNLSASKFGIKFGSSAPDTTWPDNLRFPVEGAVNPNGIWIPDLATPFDQYLVRASVTVLDHGALVNLNAHGSKNFEEWEYSDCIGKGYFISDVQPQVDLTSILFGIGTPDTTGWVPGCWGDDKKPGNPKAGAVLIESPAAMGTGLDVPYTLDEEFELRNLWGTYFQSRLERFVPAMKADPDAYPHASSLYTTRLKTTTVSWTAEVRGDSVAASHATMKDAAGADQGWSAAKADLNTASANAIYEALRDARAMPDDAALKQLAANIVGFRRRVGADPYDLVTVGGTPFMPAIRQPFFTEIIAELTSIDETDPKNVKRTYKVKVEVYNPWPGDDDIDADGKLAIGGIRVSFDLDVGHQVLPDASVAFFQIGAWTAAPDTCLPTIERDIVCTGGKTLSQALDKIRLHYAPSWQGKDLNLDQITRVGGEVGLLEQQGRLQRKVYIAPDEHRGTRNNTPIRTVYVSDWQTGGTPNLGTATKDSSLAGTAVPIRFLNCVPEGASGLPVRAARPAPSKAFARLGELNQVLRFQPGGATTWWAEPWICTVTRTPPSQENNVKFDWLKDINNVAADTGTAAAYAANALSVGGPWNDGLDNDGDGNTDFADTGQFGGPEFRVAGKINLNTATPDTLNALALGVGAPGLSTANRPFKSPAQILTGAIMTGAGLEQRDLPFTLISNIATVRSDTFSIYGTVQIVDPSRAQKANATIDKPEDIIRTRRFWALVDRSSSLAYPPDNANYIRPRILNFQWID